MKDFWISGHPVTFATKGEIPWRDSIIARIAFEPSTAYIGVELSFTLESFAPGGHPRDTDNFCEPVFFALTKAGYFNGRRMNIRWWRASKAEGTPSGVKISLSDKAPESMHELLGDPIFDHPYTGPLPKGGKDPSIPKWLDSFKGLSHVDDSDRLAISLRFGSSKISIGNISSGAVKSIIDCLFPIIGGSAGAPDDWKIDLIHVEKDCLTIPPDSVRISLWKYPELRRR